MHPKVHLECTSMHVEDRDFVLYFNYTKRGCATNTQSSVFQTSLISNIRNHDDMIYISFKIENKKCTVFY